MTFRKLNYSTHNVLVSIIYLFLKNEKHDAFYMKMHNTNKLGIALLEYQILKFKFYWIIILISNVKYRYLIIIKI